MRFNLFFITVLLILKSFVSYAQTPEIIVGSENNFHDFAYSIAVDEDEQCTYIAGSLEVSSGETIDPAAFFNINSIQGNVNQLSTSAPIAQGGEDFFIAKVDFDGIIQWFVTGGGSDDDAILDIMVGSDGNVYLTGYISFPAIIYHTSGPANSIPGTLDDKLNAFVLSLNPLGEFRWMERLGSDDDNAGLELKDGLSGLAVAGVFYNSSAGDDDTETGLNIFGLAGPPVDDDWRGAFIAFLNYDGNCQWYRAYTSPSYSYDLNEPHKLGASIDCDRENYYLTMILSGDSFYRCYSYEDGSPTNNGLQTLPNGTSIVVFKVTPEGTLDWSRTETLPSGVSLISGPYVSVSCDDVHVAATVTSSATTPTDLLNFSVIPTGSSPSILYQRRTTTSGASELIKLFPAGTDAGNTYLTAIESDIQSRVYLAGSVNGEITFEQSNPNANILSQGQGKNAWIKAMTVNSEHIWSSVINGNQDDEFTDIYLRGLSLVYFSGFSSSQTGLGLAPFGGSDPSGIYGKYSQSASTGLSDFAISCPSSLSLNSNSECGLENYDFTEIEVINPCVVQFRENDAPNVLPFGNTVVTFQAVGFSGTTQQCTTSVFVEDVSLEDEILCVPEIFRNTDENSCFAAVSIMNPVISGNCEPVTVTNNFNNSSSISGAIFPVGTTTVVWTAFFTDDDDDDGGLIPMTCNTKVHVSDITAPSMACISNLTLPLTAEGIISVTVDQIDAGSFDACDIVQRTISKTEFDCSNLGPNEVLLTAIDAHGNSNSCTTTLTVVDEIIPTAQCNNIEVQLNTDGTVSINPDQINNNSFDNCSISNLSLSQSTFNCSHLGENNITLTVTDASELQNSCSATVLVLDLGNPPTVAAGDDLNLCGNSSNVTLNPELGEGAISVEWSGGAGNFENGNTSASNTYIPTPAEIEAGSVTLTITAFGNSVCGSASDNITITFSAAPNVFAGEDQQACSDQVVVLNGATASNQTSIQWTGGAGAFTPSVDILQPNYTPTLEEFENGGVTLTITAQGGTGCAPVSDEIFIVLAKKPLAEAGADQEVCGNSVELAANFPAIGSGTWTANQNVAFTPGANQSLATATSGSFEAITFTWTVVNSFCTSVDEVVIEFFESPTVLDAGLNQTISFQGETTLSAEGATIGQGGWTSNNSAVLFENKEDPKTAVSGLQPGQNILYWIVTNGPCSAVQDSVIITVEGLIIPSGFSPNGDNINDTFEIKGIGSFEIVSIKVLNRWGEEVFASDNYKNDWNGISKSGSELPNDTYYCVIESPILEKTHTGYIIINR